MKAGLRAMLAAAAVLVSTGAFGQCPGASCPTTDFKEKTEAVGARDTDPKCPGPSCPDRTEPERRSSSFSAERAFDSSPRTGSAVIVPATQPAQPARETCVGTGCPR